MNTEISNKYFNIHQSLHGYSDGHKLLKSSLDLDSESYRIVLMMSDLSGGSIVNGFEEYLTAYPLPDGNYYAFACTWYAKEMRRPGCVWTHTLFIEKSIIREIKNLKQLRNLFKKPITNEESWQEYGEPVSFIPKHDQFLLSTTPKIKLFNNVLYNLYESPNMPVVLFANDSLEYEDIVMDTWSYQWPGLRHLFYFCTGALSNRDVSGVSFDLQIAPILSQRQFTRELKNTNFITEGDSYTNEKPEWINIIDDDLSNDTHDLISFFLKYGNELEGKRKMFIPMIRIYQKFKGQDERNIKETVEILAAQFGDRSNIPFDAPREFDLLKALATTFLR